MIFDSPTEVLKVFKLMIYLRHRTCVLFFSSPKVIKFGVFRSCRRAITPALASRSLLSLLSRSIGLEPSTPISNRSNGRTFLSIYVQACDSHDLSGHDVSNHEIPTIDDCISFRKTSTQLAHQRYSINLQWTNSIRFQLMKMPCDVWRFITLLKIYFIHIRY